MWSNAAYPGQHKNTNHNKKVSMRSFMDFKKSRESFEKPKNERNRDLNANIVPVLLRASKDDADFRNFLAENWIVAVSKWEIREEKMAARKLACFHRTEVEEKLKFLNESVATMTMAIAIQVAKERIRGFQKDYIVALQNSCSQKSPGIKSENRCKENYFSDWSRLISRTGWQKSHSDVKRAV